VDLKRISRAVILHNPVGEGDDPSTSDVLAQVDLVATGLTALGIAHQALAAPNWKPWLVLSPEPGAVVFNLMEAPPGVPHVHPAAAAALELLGLPFTGSPAGALWLTTDKLATRALLAAEGLPVAPGGRLDPNCPDPESPEILDRVPGPWILKPACEDASLGLEGDPVCSTREEALARAKTLLERFPGQNVVVETYLTGREINVSMLAGKILPIAEIVFEDFPEGMPRVVGYEAKWQEDSFAYVHTVRRFPEDPADAGLLERVGEIAEAAWRVCGLRGYARIDFRLDEDGNPYVLEVNANPCLAADAGFMAAAAKAGLTPGDVIGRILEDA
jgi:D-alanine-D-alanine ligase